MPLQQGKQHAAQIGYFVVREAEGTAELEVQDAPPFATCAEAEAWIGEHGSPDVDYWVCTPVNRLSLRRAL